MPPFFLRNAAISLSVLGKAFSARVCRKRRAGGDAVLPFVARPDQKAAHGKFCDRSTERSLRTGVPPVHGLDVSKLQIAGAVNAGNAAPHLRIDGGCKVAVGLVAVNLDRKCVAVLHNEVIGKFCGIAQRAAHIQHAVGGPWQT